jgi:hypothetical protein
VPPGWLALEGLELCADLRPGRWAHARDVENALLKRMDSNRVPDTYVLSVRLLNPMWRDGWVEKLGGWHTHGFHDTPFDRHLNLYRLSEQGRKLLAGDVPMPRGSVRRTG